MLPGQFLRRNWNFLPRQTLPGDPFTRASIGKTFDSTLALVDLAIDRPRWWYDPGGAGVRGLLVEPQTTNVCNNPPNVGVTPGTPGSGPTGWFSTGTANGSVKQTVGSGLEDNLPYCDMRYSATPPLASGLIGFSFIGANVQAAVQNQVWAASMYAKLMGGNLTNLQFSFLLQYRNAGGTPTGTAYTTNFNPTNAALKTQRITAVGVANSSTTAFVVCSVLWNYQLNLNYDATLRIGFPQLELQPEVTSPYTAGGTRSADVLPLLLPTGTYDIDITRFSGVTNLTGVNVTGNKYTVPTSASPLQKVVTRRTA